MRSKSHLLESWFRRNLCRIDFYSNFLLPVVIMWLMTPLEHATSMPTFEVILCSRPYYIPSFINGVRLGMDDMYVYVMENAVLLSYPSSF